MNPWNVRRTVVHQVIVVVEEEPLRDRPDLQVPGALPDVAPAPGVVGVLQRAPVDAEGPVAGQPADPVEVESPEDRRLETEGVGQLEPHLEPGLRGDVLDHGLEAPPARGPRLEPARRERPGHDQIGQPRDGYDRPIKAGEQAIEPIGLEPARLARQIVVEELLVGPIALVMTEVAYPLNGEGGRKEGGQQRPGGLVDPAVGMIEAVHGFMEQRKDRVVDVGEKDRRYHDYAPVRRVAGEPEARQRTRSGKRRDHKVERRGNRRSAGRMRRRAHAAFSVTLSLILRPPVHWENGCSNRPAGRSSLVPTRQPGPMPEFAPRIAPASTVAAATSTR